MSRTSDIRHKLNERIGQMRGEFATWRPHLMELAQHMAPRRARWTLQDYNRGDKINGTIINNTPLLAARVLASGFMAAVTSPMREWFRLTTPDPELMNFGPVKRYLHVVEERIRWAMAMGNFYQGLADGIYPDLGIFGFSCAILEADPKRIMRTSVKPLGEYYLSANSRGEIDTVTSELPMTVRQLVGEFAVREGNAQLPLDWSGISKRVKALWDQGQYGAVIKVVHSIQPSMEFEAGLLGPGGMPVASVWMEEGCEEDKLLRVGGFEEFPALCPRWSVRGNETYGRSPGMDCLGDAKQLQHHERRLATLIDLAAKPPMVADEAMRGQRVSLVPGDVMYSPRGQGEAYRPAIVVDPRAIAELLQHIERAESRIEEGMFAHLFTRILTDPRAQRATATEIEEMSNEVASMVGPALERLNGELLRPGVDRHFNELERRGFLPPPPEELQGIDVKPEFMSSMHQAQKAIGLQPVRVFVGELSALAATLGPSVLDKVAGDKVVDELVNVTGIKPDLVLGDDEVRKIRSVRAAREQAMQQGQEMLAAAKGARDLGTTPAPAPDNALGAVLGALSPSQAAAAAAAPLGPIASAGAAGFPQPPGNA